MVEITDWDGKISGLRNSDAEIVLKAPLKQSQSEGSKAFLGTASDGNQYWIKTLNNGQGNRVPTTEQIVARAGSLIDAPVCVVKTIEIPGKLAGWEFSPGRKLEASIVHASLAVPNAIEIRGQLKHRQKDDNAKRHASLLALYDWCWGGDSQWLVCTSDEYKIYSHDHGWFLPPEGASWSINEIALRKNESRPLNTPNTGIDIDAIRNVIIALESIGRTEIQGILQAIPDTWPVSDAEPEAVGFFLEYRAPKVAARIKNNFGV